MTSELDDMCPVDRTDPGIGAVAISGADQTFFPLRPRGIYVATAGNVAVDMANGNTVTFIGLLAGVVYPFAVKKVYASGTTITGHILL